MRNLLILMLLVFVPATFTSCRHGRTGPQGEPGMNGNDGQDGQNGNDGQDGQDGNDGIDGLNGIGFDYVRSMDGAVICNSALIIEAQDVIPANILALAPVNAGHDLEGLTLTFGTPDSPIRVYLGSVQAGEYCVVEKLRGEGWVAVGEPLTFEEDGFIAIIPPEFYNFVRPPVFADALLRIHVVEFGGECNELNYNDGHYLRIGKDIRINFNRD